MSRSSVCITSPIRDGLSRAGHFSETDAPQLFERFTRRGGSGCRRPLPAVGHLQRAQRVCGVRIRAGRVPPGHKGQLLNALRVNRIQARAHVLAYRAIHELVPGAQVGWAQHYVVFEAMPGMANRWVASLLDRLFNHTFFRSDRNRPAGLSLWSVQPSRRCRERLLRFRRPERVQPVSCRF